jgi:hypothetical protein
MRFAHSKRSGREWIVFIREIQRVVVLPRNRPIVAALRWNNVLLFAHHDGGDGTARVDRFVRGSHSRPTPRVESIVASSIRWPADQKIATKTDGQTREGASERFGRSAMSPATTGGWIANFVDGAL